MTEWFSGILAIAAVLVCIGTMRILRLELQTTNLPWRDDKVSRISLALILYAVGAVVLLIAAFAGRLGAAPEPLWFTWTAFTFWIIANTMIISITGWLKSCLILYAVWSGLCVFAVTNHWWS